MLNKLRVAIDHNGLLKRLDPFPHLHHDCDGGWLRDAARGHGAPHRTNLRYEVLLRIDFNEWFVELELIQCLGEWGGSILAEVEHLHETFIVLSAASLPKHSDQAALRRLQLCKRRHQLDFAARLVAWLLVEVVDEQALVKVDLDFTIVQFVRQILI
jgi:hypothetical protein